MLRLGGTKLARVSDGSTPFVCFGTVCQLCPNNPDALPAACSMVPDLSELRQKASALEAELQVIAQQRQQAAERDDDEVDSSEQEKQRLLRMARAELKVGRGAGRALGLQACLCEAYPL